MIEDKLMRIAAELDAVKSSPLEYLPEYGYSEKAEVQSLLEDEMKRLEDEMERNYYDYTEDELENERASICLQLGITRYC